ncbi:MAG: hypothetical protein ABSE89_10420 [Sedimentisphaerales bacterium]
MTFQHCPDYGGILDDPHKIAQFINERISSKLDWYRKNLKNYEGRKWPTWQRKVIEVFYEGNLGILIPQHGEVLSEEGDELIIKWQSPCPILRCCQKLGLATSHVCSTLYHVQYQVLLSLIVPGAFFARDYGRLRPDGSSCIEIIICRPDVELLSRKGTEAQ